MWEGPGPTWSSHAGNKPVVLSVVFLPREGPRWYRKGRHGDHSKSMFFNDFKTLVFLNDYMGKFFI
jgi:hypothetical protein